MAKLTDLPYELLLCIMVYLSPLYIDSFVLSCKRIYYVGMDTLRAQNLIRSRLSSCLSGSEPANLLRSILQVPEMAVYPLSCSVFTPDRGSLNVPQDLLTKINLEVTQSPHPGFPTVIDSRFKAADMIIPLLITRLVNLRKLRLFGFWQPYLLDTLSGIVEASHNKGRSMEEPLALCRLAEVTIHARGQEMDALHLAVLLSMIPTVKKLNASRLIYEESYSFPYKSHGSAVTNMCLNGCVHPSFVKELIMSTHDLRSFEFTHLTDFLTRGVVFRRLSEILQRHAGASLLHLSLLTEDCENCVHGVCIRSPRNHANLSLGSLRGFRNLKTLVTSVEMLIRTHDSNSHGIGVGTVQRLVSCLPASLEALVLHKGFEKWDKDVLDKLFRGLRDKRQSRLPNLNIIDFVNFPNFNQVMPGDIKAACRELGVKIGYTLQNRQNLQCLQILRQLEIFEELPWIAVLGKCYRYKGYPHCEWVSA